MSSSSISLVHPGGSVSQEHLESMCTTALAVQQIVKSKGAVRRSLADKDRFPVIDWSRQRNRYYGQPVQVPDPSKMAKRFRVEVFEMPEYRLDSVVLYGAEVFETEYETTWHDQWVEVGGLGMYGSTNQRKAKKAGRRDDRLGRKRHRKATDRKVRMTKHDLEVEALRDDVEPWTADVPVHQVKPKGMAPWTIGRSMKVLPDAPVITPKEAFAAFVENDAQQQMAKAIKEREELRFQELLARTRQSRVTQQPDPEAAAKRSAAVAAQVAEQYFANTARYNRPNTRGL